MTEMIWLIAKKEFLLNLDEERAHFSYNQLITMLSCPYKYYLQYIEQQEWDYVPSSVSFGSAMHDALSGFHKA